MLKKFWKKKAKENKKENKQDNRGFLAFVLLGDAAWDREQFKRDFKTDWGIAVNEEEDAASDEKHKDVLLFGVGNQAVAVSYIDAPVLMQEAKQNAAMNYMWKEAAYVTGRHKAQIMVTIMGKHEDIFEDCRLYVKAVTSLCRQKNVLGIYANGIVYQPEFYMEMAGLMHGEEIPLFNVIWFGLARSERGVSGYTVGLYQFGKEEIEVLDVNAEPSEVRDFVIEMAAYVVGNDVTLQDGETIGFSAEQKLPITRSKGVYTEGMTLKIAYGE